MQDLNVGVVYLAWLPYGIGHFEKFLNSYQSHPSGYRHQLIIAFNGEAGVNESPPSHYVELLRKAGVENFTTLYFSSGQDVLIYKKTAEQVNFDYLLFLNTYSVLLCDDWLKVFIQNQQQDVGLIGASGSEAGYINSINRSTLRRLKEKGSLRDKINSIRYAVKLNLVHGSRFRSFPNPHIRTTGFFISRKLLMEIQLADGKRKIDAYLFENGTKSLTRQVLARQLKCLLVDRNGKSWNIDEWRFSNTFWINEQEGLIISDNQARKYIDADQQERSYLTWDAWGIKK